MVDVSIVICAYTEQRWEQLLSAIDSVRTQTPSPREIIVVIDHQPTLVERVRAARPQVQVIENDAPRGLSGARNSGVAASTGSIVAFIDDDAVCEPGWLGHLLAGYTGPAVLGVGGAIDPIWPAARPRWFPDEFDWVVGCTYRGLAVKGMSVRNLLGANMSFRREVLENLGGFRVGLGRTHVQPLGCEETDLCIRACARWPAAHFVYTPRARVRHRVSLERTRWAYFRDRCRAEGISKARMTRDIGVRHGLASERMYAFSVVPRAVVRYLGEFLVGRDATGLQRAAAMVAGTVLTAGGYVSGWVQLVL